MSQAAENRADVLVTRGKNKREGKLLYWSSKHGRAKVLLPSGAVITVATDTVALLNGENIVADEIGVDTKYRNFRGLQPDTGGPTEPNTVVPTMGGAVASTQPRMGCETDVENHVA
jgi:hypothetical protein